MSKQKHIRLDDNLYEALMAYTDKTGSTVQNYMVAAIRETRLFRCCMMWAA